MCTTFGQWFFHEFDSTLGVLSFELPVDVPQINTKTLANGRRTINTNFSSFIKLRRALLEKTGADQRIRGLGEGEAYCPCRLRHLRHRKRPEMESQRHFRACFRHEKRKPLQSWSRADAPTRGRWIPKSFALQWSASRCLATKYKISTSSTTNSI